MTVAAVVCGSCGTELPLNSKFCNECGAPVATTTAPAEYNQVTVLFADVVHSMDIAVPWVFRSRRSGLPSKSKTATVWTSSYVSGLTPVR